jgi:ATP-dependent protease ClpP protease subunit
MKYPRYKVKSGSMDEYPIFGEITEDVSLNLFMNYDVLAKPKNRCILLNSCGGNVPDGFAIHDLLKTIPNLTIRTTGHCASSAVLILSAAANRISSPGCYFVVHPVKYLHEDKDDLETKKEQLIQTKFLDARVAEIVSDRIGVANYKTAMKLNIFDAKTALKLKLIDRIE